MKSASASPTRRQVLISRGQTTIGWFRFQPKVHVQHELLLRLLPDVFQGGSSELMELNPEPGWLHSLSGDLRV